MTDDIISEYVKRYSERLEKELLGAWRAGYNWVHVYDPFPSVPADPSGFSLSTYIIPAYSKRPPRPSGVTYRYSYDLRDVTKTEIDEARKLASKKN